MISSDSKGVSNRPMWFNSKRKRVIVKGAFYDPVGNVLERFQWLLVPSTKGKKWSGHVRQYFLMIYPQQSNCTKKEWPLKCLGQKVLEIKRCVYI